MTNHPNRNWQRRAVEELPRRRLALGYNRAEFARLIGTPYRTVERWEAGDSRPPAMLWLLLDLLEKP